MNEFVEARVVSMSDVADELSDIRPENLIDVKIINNYLALILLRNVDIKIDNHTHDEIAELISRIFYTKGKEFLIDSLKRISEE